MRSVLHRQKLLRKKNRPEPPNGSMEIIPIEITDIASGRQDRTGNKPLGISTGIGILKVGPDRRSGPVAGYRGL